MLTLPATWVARYSSKNYFAIDPVFQEDAPYYRNDTSAIARDLKEDADICPAVAELLHDAEKHGLGNLFIAVSARNPKGVAGCTVFTFEVEDEDRTQFLARMRPRLLSLAGIIHGTVCGCKDANSVASLLTPREVDCLRWAANGKTDGEIAEILSIARWTVVTYLQNAKNQAELFQSNVGSGDGAFPRHYRYARGTASRLINMVARKPSARRRSRRKEKLRRVSGAFAQGHRASSKAFASRTVLAEGSPSASSKAIWFNSTPAVLSVRVMRK